MKKRIINLLSVIILGLALSCLICDNLHCESSPFTENKKTITAWIPYWEVKDSAELFKNRFLPLIQQTHIFFYAFDKDNNIVSTSKDPKSDIKEILNLARAGAKIIPTFTNDLVFLKESTLQTAKLKDPKILHEILFTEESRSSHILQITKTIDQLENSGLEIEGVDIDYEEMDIANKDNFTQFIKDLSETLHNKNKNLIVTVPQKIDDHSRSGAGAINWEEISKYADKIIIMCYNYSSKITRPGPICPPDWLEKIIQFAQTQIPKEKICIALALHGYDWYGKQANSLNLEKAEFLLGNYSNSLKWDLKSSTPYFIYEKNKIRHEVWFENSQSITEKIKVIKKYGIRDIAFWHSGILFNSFHKPLEYFMSEIPKDKTTSNP